MYTTFELITGLVFGLEQISDPDSDGWVIILNLGILRIGLRSANTEE